MKGVVQRKSIAKSFCTLPSTHLGGVSRRSTYIKREPPSWEPKSSKSAPRDKPRTAHSIKIRRYRRWKPRLRITCFPVARMIKSFHWLLARTSNVQIVPMTGICAVWILVIHGDVLGSACIAMFIQKCVESLCQCVARNRIILELKFSKLIVVRIHHHNIQRASQAWVDRIPAWGATCR